jgi:drug/metabolite transporter (DMT)-like permease
MSWVLLLGGVAVVVVSLVNGFTSDPQTGEGWGGGVVAAVFAGGPLIAVGTALRSDKQHVARWTVAAAAIAAVVVAFALVMQLLDGNESMASRAITSLALLTYVIAAVVELPLARQRP